MFPVPIGLECCRVGGHCAAGEGQYKSGSIQRTFVMAALLFFRDIILFIPFFRKSESLGQHFSVRWNLKKQLGKNVLLSISSCSFCLSKKR